MKCRVPILFAALAAALAQQPAPAPFEAQADVGQPALSGALESDPAKGEYRITGGGANMWFASDQFHFVWKAVSGDVAIAADVRFLGEGKNAHRKAALIIRQGLEPGAAYADIAVHGDGLTSLQYRPEAGANTLEARAEAKAPRRIRIERRGNEFTAWAGDARVGPVTVALKDAVYVGLAVCSHEADTAESAVFSNVQIENLPRSGMLVSTDWLAGHLKDESLAILHVGSQKDYDAGHIPGARLVTLGDISITGERGLRLELPPVEALQRAFEKLGVADGTRVVVYPGTESVQSATRVWFTLDYLGLGERASLLDGGLAAWRAEGRPLSTEAPPPAGPGRLTVHPAPQRVVDAAWLHAHLNDGNVQVLDSRAPEFYTAGRVPGARNVPFSSVLDEQRKLKPVEALRGLMGAPKDLTVTYCHIGQQATLTYFVARYLGLEARLYDGSFTDWSSRTELPIEK